MKFFTSTVAVLLGSTKIKQVYAWSLQPQQTGAHILSNNVLDSNCHLATTRNRGSIAIQSLPSTYRKSSLFATNKSSENNINGSSRSCAGKTLSAKQILNHEVQLHRSVAALPEPVMLFSGLRLLIKSLESIIEAADTGSTDSSSSNGESILNYLDATKILRIEQPIKGEHSIDPLCWVHAQQRGCNNLRYKLQQQTKHSHHEDNTLPVIYFSDSEGHVEAAAVGKASPSYSGSWHPFTSRQMLDTVNVNGSVNDIQDGVELPTMFEHSELPQKARVYGGSRFDWQHYQNKMHDKTSSDCDWDRFGGDKGGYWILPAVELRREVGGGTGSKQIVTLAVHLHNIPPTALAHHGQDQLQHHRQGWRNAASHILTILRELSDELSPPVPCTTLPHVITQSESAGRQFKTGVAEALRKIKLDEINNDDAKMRKVVVARKVDLNFGTSVSGLDMMMSMKFGGHILGICSI